MHCLRLSQVVFKGFAKKFRPLAAPLSLSLLSGSWLERSGSRTVVVRDLVQVTSQDGCRTGSDTYEVMLSSDLPAFSSSLLGFWMLDLTSRLLNCGGGQRLLTQVSTVVKYTPRT